MLGSLTDAVGYYQLAVKLAPRNPVYWRMLASFCLDHHYMVSEIGLAAARQGVLLDPTSAESLDMMGQVFTALEDTINAERYFERAISAAPNAPSAHLHLGYLLLQEGDKVTARQQLQLASNLQPGSSIGQQADRLLQEYFPAN